MSPRHAATVTLLLAIALARPSAAQSDADTATTPAAPATPSHLQSWFSDRLPHHVGDLLTVVVSEQTAAREQVSRTATGNRQMALKLNANVNSGSGNPTNIAADIASQKNNDSRDVGEANHTGNLTAVLTVRITAIEPTGMLQVSGSKKVTVDGRTQNIALTGVVRPEDVSADNRVSSDRIAETVITFKGKAIGPKNGIIGSVLGMLWP